MAIYYTSLAIITVLSCLVQTAQNTSLCQTFSSKDRTVPNGTVCVDKDNSLVTYTCRPTKSIFTPVKLPDTSVTVVDYRNGVVGASFGQRSSFCVLLGGLPDDMAKMDDFLKPFTAVSTAVDLPNISAWATTLNQTARLRNIFIDTSHTVNYVVLPTSQVVDKRFMPTPLQNQCASQAVYWIQNQCASQAVYWVQNQCASQAVYWVQNQCASQAVYWVQNQCASQAVYWVQNQCASQAVYWVQKKVFNPVCSPISRFIKPTDQPGKSSDSSSCLMIYFTCCPWNLVQITVPCK